MDPMNPFNENAPNIQTAPQEPTVDPNAQDPNAPAATTVSQEDFQKLKDDLDQSKADSNKIISDLNAQVLQGNQLMQQGIANYTPKDVAPVPDQITGEAVMEAINNGEPGSMDMMKKFIQQSGNDEIEALKTELKSVKDQGYASLSKLAMGAGTQNLAYYDKYKEQIDALVKTSDQTNPETWKQAHAMVVGQNMDEIIKQVKEEALRTADNPPEPGSATIPGGGSNHGRNIDQGKIDLSHENVFSPAALNQLRIRGITPEQHAKNTGFDDYESFAKYKLEGEGRMIPNEPTNV